MHNANYVNFALENIIIMSSKTTNNNKENQIAINELDLVRASLQKEIDGLNAIDSWLNSDFIDALDIISNIKGKLVLSGMGKSGHVANKIAATLSSTGTPAFFVHPSEASHGDLGMITENDAVLLLSNSGETAELKDIINYCQRFSIPIISFVRRKQSLLVRASDVALVLPDSPEACDVNAPTTSTTMMMVLGDLVAIGLLNRNRFDNSQFNIYHPGGKLGSSFLKVQDLMHSGEEIPFVFAGTSIENAVNIITEKKFGCVSILSDENEILGIITDGDLRRHFFNGAQGDKVEKFMTSNPITVNKNDLASKALKIMEKKAITNLIVSENKKPIGVLHIHDILKAGVI